MLLYTYLDQLDAVRRLQHLAGEDVVPPWAREDKIRILEQLAYNMHKKGLKQEGNKDLRIELSKAELEAELTGIVKNLADTQPNFSLCSSKEAVTPELIERALRFFLARTGFLVESSHQHYQFSHLSFQEYLTALHIHRGLADHMFDPKAYLKNELSDLMVHDGWHEVGVLFFSHHALESGGNQDQLLDALIPHKMTDGFFVFWVKLLANRDNHISKAYRQNALKKIWEWSPKVKENYDLIRQHLQTWEDFDLPVADHFQEIVEGINWESQRKQLARFLYICETLPGYSDAVPLELLVESVFGCEYFVKPYGLLDVLDRYERSSLDRLFAAWVQPWLILFGDIFYYHAPRLSALWLEYRSIVQKVMISCVFQTSHDLNLAENQYFILNPALRKGAAIEHDFFDPLPQVQYADLILGMDRPWGWRQHKKKSPTSPFLRAQAQDVIWYLRGAAKYRLDHSEEVKKYKYWNVADWNKYKDTTDSQAMKLTSRLAKNFDQNLGKNLDHLVAIVTREENLEFTNRVTHKAFLTSLRRWAFALVFQPDPAAPCELPFKEAFALVQNPEPILDPAMHPAAKKAFLENHAELFGPDGVFAAILEEGKHLTDADVPTMDQVHEAFHQEVKAFIHAMGETPPSEKETP